MEILNQIRDALARNGIESRVEFPGCVVIAHTDGNEWWVGDVNDTWQGDLMTADGAEVVGGFDTYVRRDCTDPEVIATEIARALTRDAAAPRMRRQTDR